MPRFAARWLEIAREQYNALPLKASDQWTTTYGGAGLILYAVVRKHQRLLLLRLV